MQFHCGLLSSVHLVVYIIELLLTWSHFASRNTSEEFL